MLNTNIIVKKDSKKLIPEFDKLIQFFEGERTHIIEDFNNLYTKQKKFFSVTTNNIDFRFYNEVLKMCQKKEDVNNINNYILKEVFKKDEKEVIDEKYYNDFCTGNFTKKQIDSNIIENKIDEENNIFTVLDFEEQKNEINRNERKLTFSSTFSVSSVKDKKTIWEMFDYDNSDDGKINDNIRYFNYLEEPDEYYIKNAKKELLMNIFSVYYFEYFFNNELFKKMKKYYLEYFQGVQEKTKVLNYPTKIKYFHNGLEPYIFLKPYWEYFTYKKF